MREQHVKLGIYLKDIVFAANDGIITTFAVVAGVVGAGLSSSIILVIGLASLLADGFSMATGNYLGTKSEKELYKKEEARELMEIQHVPDRERLEVKEILEQKGYRGEQLETMVKLISSNEKFWVDFMMHEEIGLFEPSVDSPLKHATATFVAFILAGSLPLIPYLITFGNGASFTAAAIFSGIALFGIGALRKIFSGKNLLWSGLEMLLIGGFAAVIAYFIGFLLKSVIG